MSICKECNVNFEKAGKQVVFDDEFCSMECEGNNVSKCEVCNDYYKYEDSAAYENERFCSKPCENEYEEKNREENEE